MSNDTEGDQANNDVGESLSDFTLSIRIPQDLIAMADDASKRLGLKRADVIRLSLSRGIERLLEQLEAKQEVAQ